MGFSQSPTHVPSNDRNRTEILKLVLTCFSETIYMTPTGNCSLSPRIFQSCCSVELHSHPNKWLSYFTSGRNRYDINPSNPFIPFKFVFRQTLPLFTSLINIVFSYNPGGYLPYNYLLFTDTREPLVEVAAQLLCITLDNSSFSETDSASSPGDRTLPSLQGDECPNLFINYLSRIHRDDVRFLFE